MRSVFLLISALIAGLSGIAQVQRQRLIARTAYYDSTGTGCCFQAYDSAALKYSGNRGSRFDWNRMDYFDPRLINTGSSLILRQSAIIRPNNIDSAMFAAAAQFDTLWSFTFSPYAGRQLERMEIGEYYPDGAPHSATSLYSANDGKLRPHFRLEYVYFYGELIRVNAFAPSGSGNWTQSGERFVIRDAAGNVVLDSNVVVSNRPPTSSITRFDYNTAGSYTSRSGGSWAGSDLSDRFLEAYTYTAGGNVARNTHFLTSGTGAPEYHGYDSFEYRPGVPGYTSRLYFAPVQGSRDTQLYHYTSHLNAAGLKDTVIEMRTGDPTKNGMAIEYNSYGNPVSVVSYVLRNDNSIRIDSKRNFYYELYESEVDVPHVELPTAAVFPNPARDGFTLRFDNGIPKGRLRLTVTNAAGQLLQSRELQLTGNTAGAEFENGTPPGIYFIRITGADGRQWYRGTISKL